MTMDISNMPVVPAGAEYGPTTVRVEHNELTHVFSADGQHKYLDVATAGTKTQADGHIDASDPIWENDNTAAPAVNEREEHDYYYSINGGVLTQGSNIPTIGKSYITHRHKEVSHTLSNLTPHHSYKLELILDDLDEHDQPQNVGGTTIQVFTDAAGTKYVREEVKVFCNDVLVGSVIAAEGGGLHQNNVTQSFVNVTPDANGDIKVELALPFTWSAPSGVDAPNYSMQQGVRMHTVKAVPNNGFTADEDGFIDNNTNLVTNKELTLPPSLANFLSVPAYSKKSTASPFSIIGNTTANLILTNSFVIEMLSEEVNSYDGLVSERRSILATVPKAEDADGKLIYDVAYPVFVDLNNANDKLVRNIRARILRPDLQTLEIKGSAYMTLLIKDCDCGS